MDKEPIVRRSVGMRGDPRQPSPEHRPVSTLPKAQPDAAPAPRLSTSRHAKPKVLMGEVTAPSGPETGPELVRQREALRRFMAAHRLVPSRWCSGADVPMGELMAYLTGHTRGLSEQTMARLAQAARVTPQALFAE